MSSRAHQAIPLWIESLDLPPLMTVGELRSLLRVSRAQAYTTAREIGVVHVGRIVRIPSSAVRAWLAQQEAAR